MENWKEVEARPPRAPWELEHKKQTAARPRERWGPHRGMCREFQINLNFSHKFDTGKTKKCNFRITFLS